MLGTARCAVLFMVLGVWTSFGQCSLEIATVADFKGTFVDHASGHILARNDIVCSDSKIEREKRAKTSSSDYITLTPRQDGHGDTFRCRELFGCEKPLDLSALIEKAKITLRGSGFIPSISDWWNSRRKASTTISGRRSPDSFKPVLKTVVIPTNSSIPAVDAFRGDAPAADYYLELCPFASDSECAKTIPLAQKFSWPAGIKDDLPFQVPDMGIHLLYRLKDDDAELRTADRVLVIAVPMARSGVIPDARQKIADAEKAPAPQGVTEDAFLEGYLRAIAPILIAPE